MRTDNAAGGAAVGALAVAAGAAVIAANVGGPHKATLPPNGGAARFLTQATFGPTDASIADFQSGTMDAWFANQAAQPSLDFLAWVNRREAEINAADPNHLAHATSAQVQEAFWAAALGGQDQLRQRMAFALSQIFVVSFVGSQITPRIAAAYYNLLLANALGNYRDLMRVVTLSGAMGMYLNIIGNIEADKDPTRHPDENYAREIMQLMSIGLSKLNMDGSYQTDFDGNPIPTYSHDDIAGLAKVFTGWGWSSSTPTASTFTRAPAGSDVLPLIPYPQYHSVLSKSFLGGIIPAYSAAPNAAQMYAELDTALNIIFNHQNVPPFVAKQLIQRFVTSNPSPAYISDVAHVFANNGQGVRGDLAATIKAVLTHYEARNLQAAARPHYGKLREPMIRLANFLRAFGATSVSGNFLTGPDLSQATQLDQALLFSPTVFNFWAPSYAPPGSRVAAQGLRAPEFQAADVLTTASYVNMILGVVQVGGWSKDFATAYPNELALAPSGQLIPAIALANRLNTLLCGDNMPSPLYQRIVAVVNSTVPPGSKPTAAQIATANLYRVQNAVALVMVSTDFLIQR